MKHVSNIHYKDSDGMAATGNPPVTLRNTCPSCTRSTINPTLTGVELNTGHHDKESASNRLRDGTIQQGQEYYRNKMSIRLFWFTARLRGEMHWTCKRMFRFPTKRTISSYHHRNDSFQMSTYKTRKDGTQESLDRSKRQSNKHISLLFIYLIVMRLLPSRFQWQDDALA